MELLSPQEYSKILKYIVKSLCLPAIIFLVNICKLMYLVARVRGTFSKEIIIETWDNTHQAIVAPNNNPRAENTLDNTTYVHTEKTTRG